MKKALAALAILTSLSLAAEPVCVGDVCYPSREAAVAAGALPAQGPVNALKQAISAAASAAPAEAFSSRTAFGYMNSGEFLSFLRGEETKSPLEDKSVWLVFILVFIGGVLANLTPCVLPLVPVNVAILLGRAESSRAARMVRGFAYGAGMAVAYGVLGLAAAFGGMAFGSVQSSLWFNLAVALVLMVLGLGMLDVVNIDAAAIWRKLTSKGRAAPASRPASRGIGGAFLLGSGAAVLAGACVQPILMAMLVYTAEGFAAGRVWTVALPFVLGAGMGTPWLFVAAGLSVLPRPGAWMVWVKRVFAVAILGMAMWYAWVAGKIFSGPAQRTDSLKFIEATPETWGRSLAVAKEIDRPILVDIWATWCKNCLAMEDRTFKNVDVAGELMKFTVIRLQAENLADIAKIPELKNLGIKGIPAFIVFEKTAGKGEGK